MCFVVRSRNRFISLPIYSIFMLNFMGPRGFCMLWPPDLLPFDKLIEFRTDALHVLIYNGVRDVCAMNYGRSLKFMSFTSLLSCCTLVCLGAEIKIFIIIV